MGQVPEEDLPPPFLGGEGGVPDMPEVSDDDDMGSDHTSDESSDYAMGSDTEPEDSDNEVGNFMPGYVYPWNVHPDNPDEENELEKSMMKKLKIRRCARHLKELD